MMMATLFFSFTSVNSALYPKSYLEPIIDKETLSQPLDEHDPRRYSPVKAAKTHETSTFYYDPTVQFFLNKMMKGGRKEAARKTLDATFENIKKIQLEKYHKATTEKEKSSIILDPVKILHQAIENCKPVLSVEIIARGGIRYKVPVPCLPTKQKFLAAKWLVVTTRDADQKRKMKTKLAHELVNASNNEGKAMRKKQEMHRICEENRAYAHFRWTSR